MIVALLLGAVAPAQAAPATVPAEDIVVIGRRLERIKHLRIVTRKDRATGSLRCMLKPSSGDPMLDTGVCDAYLTCLPTADTAPALEACMRPPIVSLVERSVAAGKGDR